MDSYSLALTHGNKETSDVFLKYNNVGNNKFIKFMTCWCQLERGRYVAAPREGKEKLLSTPQPPSHNIDYFQGRRTLLLFYLRDWMSAPPSTLNLKIWIRHSFYRLNSYNYSLHLSAFRSNWRLYQNTVEPLFKQHPRNGFGYQETTPR